MKLVRSCQLSPRGEAGTGILQLNTLRHWKDNQIAEEQAEKKICAIISSPLAEEDLGLPVH